MLVKLRRVAGTWLMGIFSFLIIISFGVWGIGDIFRGRTTDTIATVGEVEISGRELTREFRREMNRLQVLFRGELDSEKARDLGLVDRALDTIVARALYDLEASRLGLAVSDNLVKAAIAGTRAFQNDQGAFDANNFASALAASGLSEDQYIALLRNDLRRTQLVGSMTEGVVAPDFVLNALYRHREERRVAEFFVVRRDSIGDVPEPDQATIEAFHQENAKRFTAPEYRELTFVHMRPEDLVDEVAVSEEALRTEFDERRYELVRPERRTIQQILVADEKTAKTARNSLDVGVDFVTVARDVAGMDEEEVKLGSITRDDLAVEVVDAVFSLAVGEISPPIESPFGWHIFRVEAIEPERAPTLAEMRPEIEHDIALRGAVDALYQLTNTLDDELAAGATLEEAADRLKLRLGHVDAVDAGGGTPSGSRADALPGTPELLRTAFATPVGETSLLVESDDGSFFIVRVDGVTPPVLRPLDTVRDQVVSAWREAERDKMAQARAADAAARVNAGESLADVAAEMGVTTRLSAAVRRDGNGAPPAFSTALINALFTIESGAATAAIAGDGSGHVVARLGEAVEADPAAAGDRIEALRKEFLASLTADLNTQYRRSLENRYPVEVNRSAVDALF